MDIDYATLEQDMISGLFRTMLTDELTHGFRQIHQAGERLPTASHYAAQIAGIVNRGADEPLPPAVQFDLYQEILAACESARAAILGEPSLPA